MVCALQNFKTWSPHYHFEWFELKWYCHTGAEPGFALAFAVPWAIAVFSQNKSISLCCHSKFRNVVPLSSELGTSFSLAHLDFIYTGIALSMHIIEYLYAYSSSVLHVSSMQPWATPFISEAQCWAHIGI